jgi:peptidoglycan hydrolase-like protein with peptidoglycan-binding domain
MSILKKGSKGQDTKNAQTLLNKAGAKPKLKVDGIFGPLTDAQTRKFQKKLKLKVDGSIGPLTMPVLKFGRPLPEMTTRDHTKRLARAVYVRSLNKMIAESYVVIEKALAKLAQVAAKEAPKAKKLIQANQASYEKSYKMIKEIADKQAEFNTLVKKMPAKAEKLVRECEVLEKQVTAFIKANFTPNVVAAKVSFDAIEVQMETVRKMYDDKRKELDKLVKEGLKLGKRA